MRHNLVIEKDKPTSLTVFHAGRVYVANPGHPNWDHLVAAVRQGAGPKRVLDLLDIQGAVASRFRALTRRLKGSDTAAVEAAAERITVERDGVYWDGEPVRGPLSEAVLAVYRSGSTDFLPLVRFMTKVMENPNAHSREALYQWMTHLSFEIADDGDLLAYKGVRGVPAAEPAEDGTYPMLTDTFTSVAEGTAQVNGATQTGKIHQSLGDVVSMPREAVNHDPSHGCSTGLHVGTLGYAQGYTYSGALIQVKVHPRDVVSVPTDCEAQKMRVCRYEVVRVVQEARPLDTAGTDWVADDEEADYAACSLCGDPTDGAEYCFDCEDEDPYDF